MYIISLVVPTQLKHAGYRQNCTFTFLGPYPIQQNKGSIVNKYHLVRGPKQAQLNFSWDQDGLKKSLIHRGASAI